MFPFFAKNKMETLPVTARRILVVDDEPLVSNAVRMVLTFAGYEVHLANGGHEALEILKPGDFDLVVTDFNMPAMQGDELALLIKTRWPGLPVLMLTAFAESIRTSPNVLANVDVLLGKPFGVAELRSSVARLLAGKNSPPHPEQH